MLPKGTYFFVDPIDVFKKYSGFFGDSMPKGNDYSEFFRHKYYSLEVPKNSTIDHITGDSINCKSGYMVLIPEALVKLEHPAKYSLWYISSVMDFLFFIFSPCYGENLNGFCW